MVQVVPAMDLDEGASVELDPLHEEVGNCEPFTIMFGVCISTYDVLRKIVGSVLEDEDCLEESF